jgi:hypothetical protein
MGVDALEEEALRRGVEGVLEPVWYNGEIVGHRRKYSDNLLMFMLKGRRPETFRDNASVEHSGQGGAPLDFTVNLVRPQPVEPMYMIASMTSRSFVVLGRPIFLRAGMNGSIRAHSRSVRSLA